MPLSGSTKYCPTFDFAMIALRGLPTPGSITATNTASCGKYGAEPARKRPASAISNGCHLVRDVDNSCVRRNAEHYRLADADRIILHIEVGHEADDTRRRRRLCRQNRGRKYQ